MDEVEEEKEKPEKEGGNKKKAQLSFLWQGAGPSFASGARATLDAALSWAAAAGGAHHLLGGSVRCCHQAAARVSQLASRSRARLNRDGQVLEPAGANVSLPKN
jgi:hypothetical protein